MGRSKGMAKQNLKLFMLRHEQGGYAIRDEGGDIVHFSDKMIAKKSKQGTQVVSYGIDHRNYKLKKGDI
jgi:hypothetical protein